MNCVELRPFLSGHLDGELDEGDRARLEEHLADCSDCRRERDTLAALAEGWRDCSRAPVEGDLWPAVAAGLPGVPREAAHAAGRLLPLLLLLPLWRVADLATGLPALHVLKLAPALFAAAAFLSIRMNPFRVEDRPIGALS